MPLFDLDDDKTAIEDLLKHIRAADRAIVSVNGCFDLFHAGHASLLNVAGCYGNVLIVGLNGDDSFVEVKGRKPYYTAAHRALVLMNHRAVDYVILYHERTATRFIETIRPDVHCKDAQTGLLEEEHEALKRVGGRFVPIPHLDCKHTSDLIREIRTQPLDEIKRDALIETIAQVNHAQWLEWSRSVANEVSEERLEHWKDAWKPYDELDEVVKENRYAVWAHVLLRTLEEKGYFINIADTKL